MYATDKTVTDPLTLGHVKILEHTFYQSPDGFFRGDSEEMQQLVAMSLMRFSGVCPYRCDEFFSLTDFGASLVRSVGARIVPELPSAFWVGGNGLCGVDA